MEAYEYCLDYFLKKVEAQKQMESTECIVPESSGNHEAHAMLE